MKKASLSRIGLTAFIIAGAVLIMLFILPRAYIKHTQDEMTAAFDELESSIQAGEEDKWPEIADRAARILESRLKIMELFLHHEYTYDLDVTMRRLSGFTASGAESDCLAEMESIKKQIEYLLSMETFDLYNLF